MNYKPIIIIGAPRSGTNMLRDCLVSINGFSTWPCDEINYIWRYGNRSFSSDELLIENITNKNLNYIRGQFNNLHRKTKSNFIIEKTCANSLRVPFVNEILPEAKYIYIIRNGYDVVGSAKLRWTAKLDIPYIFKKIRYVPFNDLFYYASRYIYTRTYKIFSKEKRVAYWGPKIKDLKHFLLEYSLDELCALQWKRCVDLSDNAFHKLPKDKVYHLKYEEFVDNPYEILKQILEFLSYDIDQDEIKEAVKSISNSSVGKGRSNLSESQEIVLNKIFGDVMERHY